MNSAQPLDVTPPDSDAALLERVDEIAAGPLAALAYRIDQEGHYPLEIIQALGEAGALDAVQHQEDGAASAAEEGRPTHGAPFGCVRPRVREQPRRQTSQHYVSIRSHAIPAIEKQHGGKRRRKGEEKRAPAYDCVGEYVVGQEALRWVHPYTSE